MGRKNFALLAITIVAPWVGVAPVQAQNYPWCAQRSDGSRYCGYSSYEQCATIGAKGSCERNYLYQPPGGAPRPKRGVR
jgi:hypothetical protein